MTDRVLRDLVLRSPAERRNGDYAVLLHLAAVAEPVPGSDDPAAAWRALRPVQGERVTRSAIAAAVFGVSDTSTAQLVGQCLRRLRGAGDKTGNGYDPPLLALVDQAGQALPPDAPPGRRGYHGYLVLPVLTGPASGRRVPLLDGSEDSWGVESTPHTEVLDGSEDSWRVESTPHTEVLDGPENSWRVESTPGKERRAEQGEEPAAGGERERTVPVPGPSLRSGPKTGTGSRERGRAAPAPSRAAEDARARGLMPFTELRVPSGESEGGAKWREQLAFQAANTAMSDAAIAGAAGLRAGDALRGRTFHPWRLAVERLLDGDRAERWQDVAVALAVLLLEEGAGDVGGPDSPRLHDRVEALRTAMRRVADGRAGEAGVATGERAVARIELAIENWRGKNLPPYDPTAGQPEEPPF